MLLWRDLMKREENTCLYLYLRLLQLNEGNIKTLNIFIFAKTKLLPLSVSKKT